MALRHGNLTALLYSPGAHYSSATGIEPSQTEVVNSGIISASSHPRQPSETAEQMAATNIHPKYSTSNFKVLVGQIKPDCC